MTQTPASVPSALRTTPLISSSAAAPFAMKPKTSAIAAQKTWFDVRIALPHSFEHCRHRIPVCEVSTDFRSAPDRKICHRSDHDQLGGCSPDTSAAPRGPAPFAPSLNIPEKMAILRRREDPLTVAEETLMHIEGPRTYLGGKLVY
jgi:hypothetical protein